MAKRGVVPCSSNKNVTSRIIFEKKKDKYVLKAISKICNDGNVTTELSTNLIFVFKRERRT